MSIMKSTYRVAWLMIMLLVVQVCAPVTGSISFAATLINVKSVAVYEEGTNTVMDIIDLNDKFDIVIELNKQAGITGTAYAEIGGSNFKPVGTSTKVAVSGTSVKYTLQRSGDNNSLPITFTDDTGTIGSETIYLSEADIIEDDEQQTSSDTKRIEKYDPKLAVGTNFEIPVVKAGEDVRFRVPLVVESKKKAKNVEITFIDSPEDLPFTIQGGKQTFEVPEVTANGATAIFDVKVAPLEKSKVYEIKIKMKFENTYGDDYETEDSFFIRVQNDAVEPIVGVKMSKFVGDTLVAGIDNAVVLTIENTGASEAKDVRVELKGFSKDGIRLFNDVAKKPMDDLEAGDESMLYYYINTSQYAKTGDYELTADISYIDIAGNEYTISSPVYVPVEGVESASIDMKVENLTYPEKVQAGDKFFVEFDLVNAAKIEAKSVEISMEYPANFIPTTSPKSLVRDYEPEQVEHFKYEFLAKDDLETNHYDLYANVSYQAKGDTEKETFKEYIGIGVNGRSGLGRPKILIDDYTFEGETVMAGEEFDLNLKFFNTSSDDIVKNIKVSVSSDEGVFSPVDSSSSFFIERIGRQEYSDYVLRLETKRDAQVKTYNLKLIMEYEDGEGNAYDSQEQPYKEEESLGIPVSQPVRLETGDVTTPFEAYAGTPADIEVEFYNMGRSSMHNMFVKLEGDFRTQDGSYFVGNFESGNSDYFTASVIPEEEGEVTGKIVFSFEDALGNPSSVEKEFSFFAAGEPNFDNEFDGEFPMDGEYPDGMESEEGGSSKWWLYGGGFIVALAAAVFFIRHRKKKKQEMLAALEDDDE